MNGVLRWVSSSVAGQDGATEIFKVVCLFGVLSGIGLNAYAVIHGSRQPFDFENYGIGLGAAIAGASAGIGVKNRLSAGPNGVRTGDGQGG